MIENLKDQWALILGASSGHGAGTALELARSGMNIFGVHLDMRATLPEVRRALSLRQAVTIDPRVAGEIPSTKEAL